MLAVQMVGTNDAALEGLRRAALTNQTFEGRDMALYAKQLATLDTRRGKGQQKVTVEHVNVEPGGQAILGNVETVKAEILGNWPDEDEPKTINHVANAPL